MNEEELISVTLPNGNVITDVPLSATQAEIKDKAISLGVADVSDFVIDPVVSLTNKKEEEQEFEILEYLRGNLDLPAGIAGSLVGAGLGVPAGPVGMFLGATALGGAATFAGSLASDELTGEDLDYNEALNQALTSMGFDVATAGIAKLLRPFYRPGVAAIQKKLGFTVEETAKQIANNLPAPGTKESLQASQKILSKEKLSLTPFQANAQGLSVLNERLARGGLLSGGIMDTNMSAVNKATQDAIQEITNRYVTNIDGSPGEIAEVLFDVISQGKKALSNNYGAALDEIILDGKNIRLPVGTFTKTAEKFIQDNQLELVNKLSDETIQYLKLQTGSLGNNPYLLVGLEDIIQINKKITQDVSQKFGNPASKEYNQALEYELGRLSSLMRESVADAISSQNPELAKRYAALNKEYQKGLTNILPEINVNFAREANKNSYKALGNLISKAGDVDKVLALRKSLQESFKQIGKAATSGNAKGLAPTAISNYSEADELIKKGFLEENFSTAFRAGEQFDVTKYASLATKLTRPSEIAKWKATLGGQYPKVKQLVNLMSEASTNPQSTLGDLLLRSKEFQAVGTLGTIAAGAGAGALAAGGVGGIAGAIAVLTVPMVMAKVATSPKHVNKLIALDKAKEMSLAKSEKVVASIVSDVLDKMTEDELIELRNTIRDANLVQEDPQEEQGMAVNQ
tara:strand:+ start:450 stop:2513 length:2064 start_codon:yes stop_codon:yes gene_type:complete